MFDSTPSRFGSKASQEQTTRPTPLKHPPPPGQTDTRPSPRDPESWLARAGKAGTMEDSLVCLNRALMLNPHHQAAARKMDEAIQHILSHNAFLGYVDEDESLYRVQTGANLMLYVPKDRTEPEMYPPQNPSPLQPAYRWLVVALLGLPLAGLGTFICLPIALMYAVRAHRQPLSQADQVRADVVLTAAIILAGAAFVLTVLMLLHI